MGGGSSKNRVKPAGAPAAAVKTPLASDIRANFKFGEGRFVIENKIDELEDGLFTHWRALNIQKIKGVAVKVALKAVSVGERQQIMNHTKMVRSYVTAHPGIVRYIDDFQSDNHFFIVTERVEGGLLSTRLSKKGGFEENKARDLITLLVEAVSHLHEHHDVVHRRLSPDSILMVSQMNDFDIKVDDFTEAVRLVGEKTMVKLRSPGLYSAPETYGEAGHGKPADIWSIGVISYTLLCGQPPWDGKDGPAELRGKIRRCSYSLQNPDAVSDEGKSFLSEIFQLDPRKRPTIRQLLKHPWISGVSSTFTKPPPKKKGAGIDQNSLRMVVREPVEEDQDSPATGLVKEETLESKGGGKGVGAEKISEVAEVALAVRTPAKQNTDIILSTPEIVAANGTPEESEVMKSVKKIGRRFSAAFNPRNNSELEDKVLYVGDGERAVSAAVEAGVEAAKQAREEGDSDADAVEAAGAAAAALVAKVPSISAKQAGHAAAQAALAAGGTLSDAAQAAGVAATVKALVATCQDPLEKRPSIAGEWAYDAAMLAGGSPADAETARENGRLMVAEVTNRAAFDGCDKKADQLLLMIGLA